MKTRKILAWLLTFSLVLSLFACNKAEGITCPECDEECDEDAAFCPACGEKLNQTVECECGHENKAGSKFCSACGASLKGGNDKLDNDTNGDKGNNDPENNDPENNDPGNNDPGNNDPGNNGQGDGEKEETPPDPAENIWLLVKKDGSDYYYNYDGLLICEVSSDGEHKFEYVYDANGNKVLQTWYGYTSKGVLYSSSETRYYNTYDEKGNLLSVQDSIGWKEEYEYDENGNLIAFTKFNGYGKLYQHIEYRYDEDNVLVEKKEDMGSSLYNYKYEDGRLQKKYYYTFMSGEGSEYLWRIVEEFRYNEQGWLTEVVFFDYDENGSLEWEYVGESYEYDEYGNVTRSNTYTWEGYHSWCIYQYMTLAEYRAQGLHEAKPDTNPGGSGSDSGSGSGSSGQGVKCEHCKGGIYECHGCDGVGQVFYTYGVYGEKLYKTCIVCHGEGFLECSYCGGDGIFGN